MINNDCETPEKCRITPTGPAMTTALYYPPVYDGFGNNLNPDRNVTRQEMVCATCGKRFTVTSGGI